VRTDVALRIVSPAPVLSTPAGIRGVVTTQSLSRVQALIAQRMTQSRSQVPDFEVRVRVDAQPIASLRQQLKADAAELVPSVTDFIVKCAAIALREQPQANGSYRGNAWELYDRVNVGIAVATDGGLIVPTIFDADQMSLGEIRRTTQDLSARARQGRIAPGELEGATFTVSNLGMFGVDSFTAVIPPHQAAILAVGAAVRAPVVRQERVVPGLVLDLALSCDHRILYGADAARLVSRIRELLEHPLSLLVE
jgi:pyruvate dehydrogenase E2 component (dihydrolipoamide acetyltransferase)